MDIFRISDTQVTLNPPLAAAGAEKSFLWIDCTHDEVNADAVAWNAQITRITGVQVYDPHLIDIVNLMHPSYFDATQDYALVVFRKLTPLATAAQRAAVEGDESLEAHRKLPPALEKLVTMPVSFLLTDNALITIHAAGSRTIEAARNRLLEYKSRPNSNGAAARPPGSPRELMLRLLNAMVDQYLDLRQPLTQQIDRWQRSLLDPRKPFNNWLALLDARIELHKLDHLCEGQHDAMQELRDYFVDAMRDGENSRESDLMLVRIHDVMEHISRVLNHARRLETSIESAVQIHFSAMSHRTSEIMRTLTVITALFMPLTLITGVFGMNFVEIPLLKNPSGFWITMGGMGAVVVILLLIFRRKRYIEDQTARRHRRGA
jgi:magnesium transporter